jgi:signal transduction histidine kinase
MTQRPPPATRSVLAEDLGLALLVAVLLLVGSRVSLDDDFDFDLVSGDLDTWMAGLGGFVLVLLGALPLTFRRIAPLTVFAVCAAASLSYHYVLHRPEPLPLGVLVALYTVATLRRPLVSGGAAAAYVLVFTAAAVSGWLAVEDDQYYIDLVAVVATVTLGYGVALGRMRAGVAEQRAAQLGRDQEARTRVAVQQEQARIAREVHDIVGHDISVMVAQAAAARRVLGRRPETVADSLTSIEAVGRDALDGLRRLVGLLRTEAERADRSPQPGLERLPWLLAQVERAGLPVELRIRGNPGPLPSTVELNAFRIVQEALTNALKHAGPTRAVVTLDYRTDTLDVEVRDEGRGPHEQPSPGFGLTGMQQRVGMLGGDLVVGPDARGFRVCARLPVPEAVA